MQVSAKILMHLETKGSLIGSDFYCYFLVNVKEMEGKQTLTLSLDFCTTSQCQSKTSCWRATVLRNWKLTLV